MQYQSVVFDSIGSTKFYRECGASCRIGSIETTRRARDLFV